MLPKIILVTGASSGFGKETANYLATLGHVVYGTSRNEYTSELVRMLVVDVLQPASITSAVDQIVSDQGRIDVLINNAGMGIGGAVELATPDEIDLQMRTNFGGTVAVCSAVLPIMRAQRQGLIINTSSIAGIFGVPYQGFYSASKFAIEGYSEALSLEVAQFGVKVVIIEPGDFNTGFTGSRHISEKTQSDTDYQLSFQRVLKNIENDEQKGDQPIFLAKQIAKIISSKHPRFRYVITSNMLQKLSVFLSKVMCARHFQWMIRLFYQV